MRKLLNKNSKRFFGSPILANTLFSETNPTALQRFRKITKPVILRKKQTIFDVGDSPRYVFFFIKGNAHLYLKQNQIKEIFVREIKQYEVLGIVEAISSFKYEIGAKTDSNCVLECAKKEDFTDFLYSESKVCFKLLGLLGNNLQNSYQNFSSSIIL